MSFKLINIKVVRLIKTIIFCSFTATLVLLITSCKKLISVAPPTSTITTDEVFADSADAIAALLGTYSSLASTGLTVKIGDGAESIFTGSSSDELIPFEQGSTNNDLYVNTIKSDNAI